MESAHRTHQERSEWARTLEAIIAEAADKLTEAMKTDYAHQIGPRGVVEHKAYELVIEEAQQVAKGISDRAKQGFDRWFVTHREG